MFGKKTTKSTLDKEQLELFQHAQSRVRQKKRLYLHFILFLIGAVLFIVANLLFNVGKDFRPFGIDWFVFPVVIWFLLLTYHFVNVFITHTFMGKAWEQEQLDKLVAKQEQRIEKLKQHLSKEENIQAQSQAYSESLAEKKKKSPKQEVTIIVAAGEDNAIGKNNELIWHLSDDLKRFKELTSGHCIIMGRKTFESFPKPLPNRTHIVITKQSNYSVPKDVITVHSLEDALDAAREDKQPFIIGGGEIYKQALSLADKIEITRIHATFENADTFFPELNLDQWEEIANSYHEKNEDNNYAFSFITYTKK